MDTLLLLNFHDSPIIYERLYFEEELPPHTIRCLQLRIVDVMRDEVTSEVSVESELIGENEESH